MENKDVKFSKTIEEVYKMLEEWYEEHGEGRFMSPDNKDFMDGYNRAVADLLFIIAQRGKNGIY